MYDIGILVELSFRHYIIILYIHMAFVDSGKLLGQLCLDIDLSSEQLDNVPKGSINSQPPSLCVEC